MTASAWVMLGLTWGVVGFFTLRFFGRILRSGSSAAGPDGDLDGDPGGDPDERG